MKSVMMIDVSETVGFQDAPGDTLKQDSRRTTGVMAKARLHLIEAVIRESWRFTAQGVSNTLWGLMLLRFPFFGSVAVPSPVIVRLKKSLLNAFARECHKMSEQELANSIYALGKLGFDWVSDLMNLTSIAGVKTSHKYNFSLTYPVPDLLQSLEDRCSSMTSAGIVMTLLGLSRLGFRWEQLQKTHSDTHETMTVIDLIYLACARVIQIASDESVSILIHSLAATGANWDDLGPQLQTAIEESISRSHFRFNSRGSNTPTEVSAVSLDNIFAAPSTDSINSARKISSINSHSQRFRKRNDTLANPFSSSHSTASSFKKSNPLAYSQTSQYYESIFLSENVALYPHFHLIHSLGLLRARWDGLGYSVRSMLLNGLMQHIDAMDDRGVVNTFHGLANLGSKWTDLRQEVRQKLLVSLVRVSSDLVEQGVSLVILALAKLEVCWQDDLPDIVKSSLRRAISRQGHLGEHALSSLLFGLGKLDRKWTELHPEVRQTLKAAIVVCHIEGRISPDGVANSIYGMSHQLKFVSILTSLLLTGLGAMFADWSNLSSSVRLALLSDISAVVLSTSAAQLTNILTGLGRMGASFANFPVSCVQVIESQIEKCIPDMNDQHLSSLLFALRALGRTWNDISVGIQKLIMGRLFHLFGSTASVLKLQQQDGTSVLHPDVSLYGFVLTLASLARFRVNWMQFPLELTSSITDCLAFYLPRTSLPDVASILSSFVKIGLRWETLPEAVRITVVNQILSSNSNKIQVGVTEVSSLRDKSIIVSSLGGLGAGWDSIGTAMCDVLIDWLQDVCQHGSVNEVAGVVFGFGLMECSWGKLNPSYNNYDTGKNMISLTVSLNLPLNILCWFR